MGEAAEVTTSAPTPLPTTSPTTLPQIFQNQEFGEVRTIVEGEKVFFCGSDVARALGYANPSKALSDHCKGVTKRYTPTAGGAQEMSFIPEGDLYRLIVSSHLPSAEKFERWVFEEVLPSIRRHGAYLTPQKAEEIISNPDAIIQLATMVKEERSLRAEAERKIAVVNEQNQTLVAENSYLESKVEELSPAAAYTQEILASPTPIDIGQLAKDYGMSSNVLSANFLRTAPP